MAHTLLPSFLDTLKSFYLNSLSIDNVKQPFKVFCLAIAIKTRNAAFIEALIRAADSVPNLTDSLFGLLDYAMVIDNQWFRDVARILMPILDEPLDDDLLKILCNLNPNLDDDLIYLNKISKRVHCEMNEAEASMLKGKEHKKCELEPWCDQYNKVKDDYFKLKDTLDKRIDYDLWSFCLAVAVKNRDDVFITTMAELVRSNEPIFGIFKHFATLENSSVPLTNTDVYISDTLFIQMLRNHPTDAEVKRWMKDWPQKQEDISFMRLCMQSFQ